MMFARYLPDCLIVLALAACPAAAQRVPVQLSTLPDESTSQTRRHPVAPLRPAHLPAVKRSRNKRPPRNSRVPFEVCPLGRRDPLFK